GDLLALVPNYVSAIPADQFDPNGGRLKMAVDKTPRLYSVGVNGIDDGGRPDSPIGSWGHLDDVFLLAPPAPSALPETKPAADEQDAADAPNPPQPTATEPSASPDQ